MNTGARATSMWLQLLALANDPRLRLPPLADWPLRAALGDPAPLAAAAQS